MPNVAFDRSGLTGSELPVVGLVGGGTDHRMHRHRPVRCAHRNRATRSLQPQLRVARRGARECDRGTRGGTSGHRSLSGSGARALRTGRAGRRRCHGPSPRTAVEPHDDRPPLHRARGGARRVRHPRERRYRGRGRHGLERRRDARRKTESRGRLGRPARRRGERLRHRDVGDPSRHPILGAAPDPRSHSSSAASPRTSASGR